MFIIEKLDSLGKWVRCSSASSESAANVSASHMKKVQPSGSYRVTDKNGNVRNVV